MRHLTEIGKDNWQLTLNIDRTCTCVCSTNSLEHVSYAKKLYNFILVVFRKTIVNRFFLPQSY